MTARCRLFIPIFFLFGVLPYAGQAQIIRGIVREESSGSPIPEAEIHVIDTANVIVAASSSVHDGAFSAVVSEPGTYRLRVTAMGYDTTTTGVFVLGPYENRNFDVFLPVRPVPLDSLEVVGEPRTPHLELVGFYRRMEVGFGHFIQKEEIDRSHADRITDLLYGLPSVRIVRGELVGELLVVMRACPQPPTVVLDGLPLDRDGGPINEVTHPANIEAIEVYPSPAGVPVQYGRTRSPCGTILIWTRR